MDSNSMEDSAATASTNAKLAVDSDFNLGSFYREHYRSYFRQALTTGDARPLVIPYSLLGSFVLPIAYLCIPHARRPWLRRARWAIAAAVVALNVDVLASNTSSTNMAVGYATGLIASWGTVWALANLVFLPDAQVEAKRIRRRRKVKVEVKAKEGNGSAVNGSSSDDALNGGAKGGYGGTVGPIRTLKTDKTVVLFDGQYEYEHYWQPYPENGSFAERFDWVMDLYHSYRGIGWNRHISAISSPLSTAQHPKDNTTRTTTTTTTTEDLVLWDTFDSSPLATQAGYTRHPTRTSFLLDRLFRIAIAYFVLDIWTVTARLDPYFIVGPDAFTASPRHPYTPLALPAFYAALHPSVLSFLRSIFGLLGAMGGLVTYVYTFQLLQVFVLAPLATLTGDEESCAHELWQYPSLYGSFTNVLDKGLAGWWGGWWHQSFRMAFRAPTGWMVRQGWFRSRSTAAKLVEGLVAFTLSGLMHSAGGWGSINRMMMTASASSTSSQEGADTGEGTAWPWWSPLLFFLLSYVGILVQNALSRFVIRPMRASSPGSSVVGMLLSQRWLRRLGNLCFTIGWLHATRWALIDDMGRAGLWLYEPTPISPIRLLGLGGLPGESWWRFDREYIPSWWAGRGGNWWESGMRI